MTDQKDETKPEMRTTKTPGAESRRFPPIQRAPVAAEISQIMQPPRRTARRHLVRLRREQQRVRGALLAQESTLPPARDPLGP